MSRVLVVFASFDGQSARIAERIGAVLEQSGHAVTLRSADTPGIGLEIDRHDAVLAGAAIRYGRHARSLERLARAHAAQLAGRPNAFFSVCLSAGGPGAKPAVAEGYVADFRRRTGWEPRRCASFAGALCYSRYGPFIRLMMRLIVGAAGGDTDTSRDYEYTDWKDVERFARECASDLAAA
jgi:menaquinone-dependent protoporphyrinogen oxidase